MDSEHRTESQGGIGNLFKRIGTFSDKKPPRQNHPRTSHCQQYLPAQMSKEIVAVLYEEEKQQ